MGKRLAVRHARSREPSAELGGGRGRAALRGELLEFRSTAGCVGCSPRVSCSSPGLAGGQGTGDGASTHRARCLVDLLVHDRRAASRPCLDESRLGFTDNLTKKKMFVSLVTVPASGQQRDVARPCWSHQLSLCWPFPRDRFPSWGALIQQTAVFPPKAAFSPAACLPPAHGDGVGVPW